jgi:anti-sigma factor RsiW
VTEATRRFDAAEAFAYVDNCLAPAERQAFQARLLADPELRRQVAQWESQNKAIRAAYGAPASARAPIDLAGNTNENGPASMTAATPNRPNAAARRASGEARPKPARAPLAAPPARFRALRRFAAAASLAAILLCVSGSGGPTPPRDRLAEAALAAYRAFAAASDTAVEFRTRDSRALAKWLTPQFVKGIAVPGFSSDALTLLGARIAPGMRTSAAFLLYEDRGGQRVGLLIEPLDDPAPSKPSLRQSDGVSLAAWTGAGDGFAAAGADAEKVALLMRLVEQSSAAR